MSLVGKKAPNFSLPDQNDNIHSLADYDGKYLVIYFYPKDLTSGCTVEANNFRDAMKEFKRMEVTVIGVSCDPIKKHQKFIEKEGLNFNLLSDEEKQMVQDYGVWVEKSMYGKKYMGIQRDTFLIGPDQKIIKHYVKVKPKEHVQELLDDLHEIV